MPSVATEKTCENCGASFYPTDECKSRVRRFCSKDCTWAWQKQKALDKYPSAEELRRLHHDERMAVEAIGKRYGKSGWWAKKALAARGVREVFVKAGRQLKCEECGELFYAKRSEIGKGRKYCSSKCNYASREGVSYMTEEARKRLSEQRKGPGNPAWKGGYHTRRVPYRKSKFSLKVKGESSCRNCGCEDRLHLHHVIPRSMYRDGREEILNGIPLCYECHMGWHYRKVTLSRVIFTQEEWEYLTAVELLGQEIDAWLDERYPGERPV